MQAPTAHPCYCIPISYLSFPSHFDPCPPIPVTVASQRLCLRSPDHTRNGRHVVTTQCGGWVLQNPHVESEATAVARDAREAQIKQLSHLHTRASVPEDAVCVLAGDFNLRPQEERPLLSQGWRDAWLWPAALPGEAWTWSRHGHKARYDRVFVHNAQNGATAERQAITRLSGFWPALSDHLVLHAVFVRRPGELLNYSEQE